MKDQYNQSLTPQKAAEGMKLLIQNAEALYNDALLLFNNDRYNRAVALAILAMEEIGKIPIIRYILICHSQSEVNQHWKRFRSHYSKNWGVNMPALWNKDTIKFEDLKTFFEDDQSQSIENIKQLSVYVDLFKQGGWHFPAVPKEVAGFILAVAEPLVFESSSMTSEAELKIWVKHMKPVSGQEEAVQKQALLACYKEAEAAGVLSGKVIMEDIANMLGLSDS